MSKVYFILKINRLFYFVSVLNFLFSTICPLLNCCGGLSHPAKIKALPICFGGLRIAGAGTELERSRSAVSKNTHIDFNGNLLTLPPFRSRSTAVLQLVEIGG